LRVVFSRWPNRFVVAPFTDSMCLKRNSNFLWVDRDFQRNPQLDLLADPDLLFSLPGCKIVKDQRKIKVGRARLEIDGKPKGIYLKRYNAFSWRYRLASLFFPSGASRSWIGAGILMRSGFQTGRPIAAVEFRSWGMLTKSFYLSEEIQGGRTADTYWREELTPLGGREGFLRRRNFLRDLAWLFRSLHAENIYHNDLKDANILVSHSNQHREERFYLLDLEGIRSYRYLDRRRRIKNLVQLNRTMGRLLRRTEKLYWLKAYLSDVFFSRGERRMWISEVQKMSVREDRRSSMKALRIHSERKGVHGF